MPTLRYLSLLLTACGILALPAIAPAQIAVGVSVHVGPPALPVYEQPLCPAAGYIWTPGYWAYGDDDYYWVPGTWVLAPRPGFLWTPGYWGWGGGVYAWHGGYWGPHVGFYGGINYGFGYGGVGFAGGYWNHGAFFYNSSVSHVNVTVIHNTYNKTVIVNNVHTSFNGGEGGIRAHATREEEAAGREHHIEATHEQVEHQHSASTNRSLRASENHGRPAIAATSRPGQFSGKGVVAAKANGKASRAATHTSADRPSTAHPSTAHSAKEHASTPHSQPASHTSSAHSNASHGQNKTRTESKSTPHAESKPHASSGGARPKAEEKKPHR
jgi:hypothetical protein